MYGVGGLLGNLYAAFITQYLGPAYIFGFYAIMGLLTSLTGLLAPVKKLENVKNLGEFCRELGAKLKVVWEMTKHPLIWQFYLYIILSGMRPQFGEFEYYFLLDVVRVSDFLYAMIQLVGSFNIILTIWFYQFFKHLEVRYLLMIGMFVNSLAGLFGVILGKRWNLQWGIPDGVLYWVTDTGFGDVAFTFT